MFQNDAKSQLKNVKQTWKSYKSNSSLESFYSLCYIYELALLEDREKLINKKKFRSELIINLSNLLGFYNNNQISPEKAIEQSNSLFVILYHGIKSHKFNHNDNNLVNMVLDSLSKLLYKNDESNFIHAQMAAKLVKVFYLFANTYSKGSKAVIAIHNFSRLVLDLASQEKTQILSQIIIPSDTSTTFSPDYIDLLLLSLEVFSISSQKILNDNDFRLYRPIFTQTIKLLKLTSEDPNHQKSTLCINKFVSLINTVVYLSYKQIIAKKFLESYTDSIYDLSISLIIYSVTQGVELKNGILADNNTLAMLLKSIIGLLSKAFQQIFKDQSPIPINTGLVGLRIIQTCIEKLSKIQGTFDDLSMKCFAHYSITFLHEVYIQSENSELFRSEIKILSLILKDPFIIYNYLFKNTWNIILLAYTQFFGDRRCTQDFVLAIINSIKKHRDDDYYLEVIFAKIRLLIDKKKELFVLLLKVRLTEDLITDAFEGQDDCVSKQAINIIETLIEQNIISNVGVLSVLKAILRVVVMSNSFENDNSESSAEIQSDQELIKSLKDIRAKFNSPNDMANLKKPLTVFQNFENFIFKILYTCKSETVQLFLSYLESSKKTKTILWLINILNNVLNQKTFRDFIVSQHFTDMVNLLINILEKPWKNAKLIVNLWSTGILCLNKIMTKQSFIYIENIFFDTLGLVSVLRRLEYKEIKEEICMHCIECIFEICLSEDNFIKYPNFIPLLIHMACTSYSTLTEQSQKKFSLMLENTINLEILAKLKVFSIILYNFSQSPHLKFWPKFTKTLKSLMSISFTLSDLSYWVNFYTSCESDLIQKRLLKLLKSALKISMKDFGFKKYLYLLNKNIIKITDFQIKNQQNSLFILKDEFSLSFWIYPINPLLWEIFSIKCPQKLSFSLENFTLILHDGKTYKLKTPMKPSQWNLVTITFNKKKSKTSQVKVYQNNQEIPFNKSQPKISNRITMIKSLKLKQNTYGDIKIFGALTGIYLFSKELSPIMIYTLWNLGPIIKFPHFPIDIPDNVRNAYSNLHKIFIYDFLYNEINSYEPYNNIINISHTDIFDTLKVYGFEKFIGEINTNLLNTDFIQYFYKIVLYIIKKNYISNFVDEDFIRSFAYYVNQRVFNEKNCSVLSKIYNECNVRGRSILAGSLLYCKEFFMFFKKDKNIFNILIGKYRLVHSFSRENLFMFCLLISDESVMQIMSMIEFYLGEENDMERYRKDLIEIFGYFLKAENYLLAEGLLKIILKFRYTYCKMNKHVSIILSAVNRFKNSSRLVIEILLVSNSFCIQNSEKSSNFPFFYKIFSLIDYLLPKQLDIHFIDFLLKEGYNEDSPIDFLKYNFIDLVMKRIYFIDSKEIKDLILKHIRYNADVINQAIVGRDIFFEWVNKYIEFSEEKAVQVLNMIINLSYSDKQQGVFLYLMMNKPNALIYSMILEKNIGGDVNNEYFYLFSRVLNSSEKKIEYLYKCFKIMKDSKYFIDKIVKSYELINPELLELRPNKILNIGSMLAVQYIIYLSDGMGEFLSQNQEFPFFKDFLSNPKINYFNCYQTSTNIELKFSEQFLAIFVFTELFRNYSLYSKKVIDDLNFFIIKSAFFSKLSDFFSSNFEFIKNCINIYESEKSSLNFRTKQTQTSCDIVNNMHTQDGADLLEILDCAEWKVINLSLIYLKKIFRGKCSNEEMIIESIPDNKISSFDIILYSYKKMLEKIDKIYQGFSEEYPTRFLYKMYLDTYKNEKKWFKAKRVLNDEPVENIKVRQVYDKYGRWSTISPNPTEKMIFNIKNPLINDSLTMFPQDHDLSDLTSLESFAKDLSLSQLKLLETVNSNYTMIFKVERIKVEGAFFGNFYITPHFIELIFCGEKKPQKPDFDDSLPSFGMIPKHKRYIWYLSEFKEIIRKRFLHKHIALEFITIEGKSYYINFFKENHREEVINIFKTWGHISIPSKIPTTEINTAKNLWKQNKISNFEYLMILNKYSSRSCNDLSQYPIFPWIISEYSSEFISFQDKFIQRILKYPVRAQNENIRNSLKERYENWNFSNLDPFHYGSHYSCPAIVLYYTIRLEPYKTQAKDFQGGKFDIADRLFLSFLKAWRGCVDIKSTSCKELIPELFFSSYIFNNFTQETLGITHDKIKVINIEPPKWAESNWDFLVKHRMILESPSVSEELPNWIDLIFGIKQINEPIKCYNIFCPYTYESKYNEECEKSPKEIVQLREQMYHFGQCPIVLFDNETHEKKKYVKNEYIFYKVVYMNYAKEYSFGKFAKNIINPGLPFCIFYLSKYVLVLRLVDRQVFMTKYKHFDNEVLKLVDDYVLKNYVFCNFFEFREILISGDLCHWQIKVLRNGFEVMFEKFLLAGMDCSQALLIYDLKGQILRSLFWHSGIVTCVSCTGDYVFSGSIDSSIVSWKLTNDIVVNTFPITLSAKTHRKVFKEFSLSPKHIFSGHSTPVTYLQVLESYSLLISFSIPNTVLIHDIKNAECLYKINKQAHIIQVSEMGIIGLYTQQIAEFFGVNKDLIRDEEQILPDMIIDVVFSCSGDFVLECYEDTIVVRDFCKRNSSYDIECSAKCLAVHPKERNIAYLQIENNGKWEVGLLALEHDMETKEKKDFLSEYTIVE
ncbi:hypothetical protein SteCoe_28600 [Stentor coeruleus]|uniref:BEACH domain-containing protein n=1 Tax=Stentor coeruleus TaxID=5963 RepID=A0A1R2B8E7_9CILI|nr:hypothetical protein SteCoe_28600 [Stentor coeruleus]